MKKEGNAEYLTEQHHHEKQQMFRVYIIHIEEVTHTERLTTHNGNKQGMREDARIVYARQYTAHKRNEAVEGKEECHD